MAEILFKTIYSAHEYNKLLFSKSGSKTRPNYKPKFDENGHYELVEDGVFHSYEDIQAWLPSTDMSSIIDRYLKTGDTSLLQQRAAFYADVTSLPSNYAELHNMLQHADDVFMSLPVEIREEFGHNPAGFYADSDKANEVVSHYLKSKETVPVVETVTAPVVETVGGDE